MMPDNNNTTTRRNFMTAGIGAATVAAIGFNRMAQAQEVANPVTVVVSFRMKEGKEEEAKALLMELTSGVKENEPGALAYVAHSDADDPMKITFIEIYKDQAALQAHRNDPAVQAALPKFGEVFDMGAPEVMSLNRVAGFTRQS